MEILEAESTQVPNSPPQVADNVERLSQLDSLRGLSALFVVFHHLIWTRFDTQLEKPEMPRWFWIGFKVLHPLFSGWESVIFFFVLSGFVLTVSIRRRRSLRYGHYVLHRLCRIYLPYLVSLLLAIIASSMFYDQVPHWTSWTSAKWVHRPEPGEILNHILFLGTYPHKFNTVYWSLIIELRVSLLLPFLIMLVGSLRMRNCVFLLGVLSVVDAMMQPLITWHGSETVVDWLRTGHYALFFAYGVMAAFHGRRVGDFILHTGRLARLFLLTLSFALLYYLPVILRKSLLSTINDECLIAMGATGIVCLAINDVRFAQLLNRSPLIWLGKISYSLYLIHMTVILSLASLIGSRVSYLYVFVLSVGLSLALAWLMSRYIERPSQRLGRMLDRESQMRSQS